MQRCMNTRACMTSIEVCGFPSLFFLHQFFYDSQELFLKSLNLLLCLPSGALQLLSERRPSFEPERFRPLCASILFSSSQAPRVNLRLLLQAASRLPSHATQSLLPESARRVREASCCASEDSSCDCP